MTSEGITAASAAITTLVIAATAIAAVIQIRQLKLATQLEGYLALHREFGSPEMYAIRQYVANELPKRLLDQKYRDELESGTAFAATHPELVLGNFWEKVGTLVSTGLLAPNLYLETGAYRVIEAWDQLSDVIALRRKKEPLQWAGFDHIVGLSREYLDNRRGLPQTR
jgi:hypothetical protein